MVQGMFFGLIDPAYGPLSKTTPGYSAAVEAMYRPDRNRAIALLEEAGWKMGPGGIRVKDGQPLSVGYFVPPPMGQDVAVQMQAEARRVGIDLKVENITFARMQELVFANTYDMLPLRWINADPSLLAIPFHSRNIAETGRYRFNWARIQDPKMDELLAQGEAIVELFTSDVSDNRGSAKAEFTAGPVDPAKRVLDRRHLGRQFNGIPLDADHGAVLDQIVSAIASNDIDV